MPGRLPACCGAPAAASRLTAGLPAGPGFSRSPPRQTTQTLNLVGLYTLEVSISPPASPFASPVANPLAIPLANTLAKPLAGPSANPVADP